MILSPVYESSVYLWVMDSELFVGVWLFGPFFGLITLQIRYCGVQSLQATMFPAKKVAQFLERDHYEFSS